MEQAVVTTADSLTLGHLAEVNLSAEKKLSLDALLRVLECRTSMQDDNSKLVRRDSNDSLGNPKKTGWLWCQQGLPESSPIQ